MLLVPSKNGRHHVRAKKLIMLGILQSKAFEREAKKPSELTFPTDEVARGEQHRP